MPFRIIRNDITKVRADAIVNTANPEPIYASGTDYAVYQAAGANELLNERKKIGSIHPGEAAVTPAFRLHAKYIIHTVGPEWIDGHHGEFVTLSSCYRKSLLLARQLGCGSIAFPLISTGVYGFPKDEALRIALDRIREFLDENEMDVMLVVFDKKAFTLSSSLVDSVEQFIDEKYVESRSKEYRTGRREEEASGRRAERRRRSLRESLKLREPKADGSLYESASQPFYGEINAVLSSASVMEDADDAAYEDILEETAAPGAGNVSPAPSAAAAPAASASPAPSVAPASSAHSAAPAPAAAASPAPSASVSPAQSAAPSPAPGVSGRSLQDLMSNVGETFQQCLLRMIDERGLTDTEVYKRANIDRKLFSKIRCNENYNPKKKTALALAVALHLNLDETIDLLGRAGFALSPSSRMDLIVEYCIVNKIYDTFKIDSLLFEYNQPTLA